jgi:DNA-binding LacI/PurR family transcriptional regulator
VAAPPTERRATVADVARATGVSVATVSKVLNDRADVSAETRALVRASLQEHRYMRTPRATSRRHPDGPGLLDMVFTDPGSPWAAEMIRGVEATARENRVSLVISALDGEVGKTNAWLDDVAARGSKGAILVAQLSSDDQERLSRSGIPMVIVDPVGDFQSRLPSFGADNWGGGMTATQHLVDLGHRRIGTITGPLRYFCSHARLAGFRAALERAGLEADPELIRQGDFHYQSSVAGALALLDLDEPPTAIFAANDEQALGVYAAAQMRGLRVPDDLSVVGFDDVPMSQWVLPGLTTVSQPIRQLAELATRALLTASKDDEEMPRSRTELPTTLVVRGSTAPPGGGRG